MMSSVSTRKVKATEELATARRAPSAGSTSLRTLRRFAHRRARRGVSLSDPRCAVREAVGTTDPGRRSSSRSGSTARAGAKSWAWSSRRESRSSSSMPERAVRELLPEAWRAHYLPRKLGGSTPAHSQRGRAGSAGVAHALGDALSQAHRLGRSTHRRDVQPAASHHKHLKSTNMLEREEIKRRTRRIFPNAASCLRLVGVPKPTRALEDHRYLNMEFQRTEERTATA